MIKYLTKAKLWNFVKYYSQNANWTHFYIPLQNYMWNWGIFMLKIDDKDDGATILNN